MHCSANSSRLPVRTRSSDHGLSGAPTPSAAVRGAVPRAAVRTERTGLHDARSGTAAVRDLEAQRDLEARAAGLKVISVARQCRRSGGTAEACGGAGYLAENRLVELRADTDVFTTFEGDNHVLPQLVAKYLLTGYNGDIKGMSPFRWVRFAANAAGEQLSRRTAPTRSCSAFSTTGGTTASRAASSTGETQAQMFEDRVSTCEPRWPGASRSGPRPCRASMRSTPCRTT